MIKPSPTQARVAVGALSVSAVFLVAVLKSEGYKDDAYLDSGKVPTIGAGRTEGVKLGDTTNPVREMVYLLDNLEGVYGAGIRKCIKVPLYQREFNSLTDAAYNAGVGGVCRDLAPIWNAAKTEEDYAAACEAFIGWRETVKGKSCRDRNNNCYGLVKRRQLERDMCLGLA